MNTVYMVGAGPGDPELITVKGQRIVNEADIIIYAGSLVNKAIIAGHKADAEIFNSASMPLDDVIAVIKRGTEEGKKIARVHTGDPSIYGAIREQMDRLDELGIPFDVIPGVSSFVASAAALKKEFTLPDVSQTVILTRLEGRTPVPEKEKLEDLASHQASMCIFLSVQMIDDVARVAKALKTTVHADKINYGIFGDNMPHLHFHIVPKIKGGKDWGGTFEMSPADKVFLSEEAQEALIAQIKSNL